MDEIIKKIDKLLNEDLSYENTSQELVKIYYLIGKYIYENKTEFKYKIIYEIEEKLRNKYGLIIGFTKRNLMNMYKFYNTYKEYDLNNLSLISWNKHLLIMKYDNKEQLINYCIRYNINKKDLEKIIKKGFNKKYISNNIDLDDNMTKEIIKIRSSKE
jgi:hypothetical protein